VTRRSYLLVVDPTLGTMEAVAELLERIPEIIVWRSEILGCFFLVSDYSASLLAEKFFVLKNNEGRGGKFIIAECTRNTDGQLTEAGWHVLNAKELLGPPNFSRTKLPRTLGELGSLLSTTTETPAPRKLEDKS